MVTAEEIITLGFMPDRRNQKVKQSGYSAKGEDTEGNLCELRIVMNYYTGSAQIIYTEATERKLIYEGEVSSINELEEKIQDGEY